MTNCQIINLCEVRAAHRVIARSLPTDEQKAEREELTERTYQACLAQVARHMQDDGVAR